MTLEELYYISQIIAVVGIFASLVFVGLQIRQRRVPRFHRRPHSRCAKGGGSRRKRCLDGIGNRHPATFVIKLPQPPLVVLPSSVRKV
jgi:hypothetical protein